jgi:endonuclease/exonuclease/phosphatase (EEP) superfamily protein YafD
MLLLWTTVGLTGDVWWPTTLVLFGPRWVWALPLAVLAPAAALSSPRSLWVLLNAAVVVLGPVMGFRVPWGLPLGNGVGGVSVRVVTCNGQGSRIRGDELIALVDQLRADVLVLQEIDRLPGDPGFWRGWHTRDGRGVCLASRFPIRDVEELGGDALGGDGEVVRYGLETRAGMIDLFGLHLETPREGLEAVMIGRWKGIPDLEANLRLRSAESESASRWVARSSRPFLVAGDFNLPVDSRIYDRSWSWLGNAFSEAGWGFGATKFTRWHGVRIDHVLGGPGWACRSCWVGPDVGSDHRPVIADMDLSVPR